MTIRKSEKSYTVRECKDHWSVSTNAGGLSVNYKVDKALCETAEELTEYIKNNDMF